MLKRDSYANRRNLGFGLDWPTRSNFRKWRSDLDNGLKRQPFENDRRMGYLHLNGCGEVMTGIPPAASTSSSSLLWKVWRPQEAIPKARSDYRAA